MEQAEVDEGQAQGVAQDMTLGSRWVLSGAVAAMTLLSVGLAIAISRPDEPSASSGAATWLGSHVFSFASYWVITASVVYGLLLSTRIAERITRGRAHLGLHHSLAAIGLGLAGAHGVILMLDDRAENGFLDVVIPALPPEGSTLLIAGQTALYLLAFVVASLSLRKWVGAANWRILHGVTIAAFIMATLHGLLAGTDAGEEWALWVYAIATAMVVVLVAYRIWQAYTSRP